MPLPYYNNIPQPAEFKDESQPLMLANFAALTSFGNGYCDLPVVGSQPPTLPLTSLYDDAIYTFPCTQTGIPELYVHAQNYGSISGMPVTREIPITASTLSQGAPVAGQDGWTMLSSGLIMQWFKTPTPGQGFATITPPVIPFTISKILSVQITPHAFNPSVTPPDYDIAVTLLYYNSPAVTFNAYFSNRTSTGPATNPFYAQVLLIGAI